MQERWYPVSLTTHFLHSSSDMLGSQVPILLCCLWSTSSSKRPQKCSISFPLGQAMQLCPKTCLPHPDALRPLTEPALLSRWFRDCLLFLRSGLWSLSPQPKKPGREFLSSTQRIFFEEEFLQHSFLHLLASNVMTFVSASKSLYYLLVKQTMPTSIYICRCLELPCTL